MRPAERDLLTRAGTRLDEAGDLVLAAARMGDANFHVESGPDNLIGFALRAAAEKMLACRLGELCGAEIAKRVPASEAKHRVLALRDEYERLRIELGATPGGSEWLAWAEAQIADEGPRVAAEGARIGEARHG